MSKVSRATSTFFLRISRSLLDSFVSPMIRRPTKGKEDGVEVRSDRNRVPSLQEFWYVVLLLSFYVKIAMLTFASIITANSLSRVEAKRLHLLSYLPQWNLQCHDDHPAAPLSSLPARFKRGILHV